MATTIRKGGMVTDGPFIKSKEVFAGIFPAEARDLDQAIAIGEPPPSVEGGVEIRTLYEE
ncbi:YciI family protein [Streptosporangium sp. NPDC002607]